MKAMKKVSSEDILGGDLMKVMIAISIPIIITNLIDGFYGIIDSLFVAYIGSLEIAAVTFVAPIYETLNAIGVGLAIAGGSIVGRYLGERDEEKVKHSIEQLSMIGLILGLIIGIGSTVFSQTILIRASITPSLLEVSETYYRMLALSVPFWYVTLVFLAIRRAHGDTQETMKINMLSLILKVVFSVIFILVFKMGLLGLGLSSLLAKVCCSMRAFYGLFFAKDALVNLKKVRARLDLIKRIAFVSFPLIIEKSMVSFGFVIVNKYVLDYGEAVLAAYGLTNKVNTIFFKATAGFGTALAVIVAQNMGAGNVDRVKEAIKKSLILAVGFALFSCAVLLPFKEPIAALFVDPADPTYQHMINAMSVYTASVIPWAVMEVAMGLFQGTTLTTYNLTVSVLRIYLFRVPIVMFLTMPIWGLAEYGIWYAMLISNIFSATLSMIIIFVRRARIFKVDKITQNS
ncbi:MAG: hypothetical protein BEN18_07325 [Epulopiscium sp. Nuni2H_MBin001]|nr:MAG: hypothetical protein BEN18_07325 [Epulopiscium sp. Nuni2H_MBin001]